MEFLFTTDLGSRAIYFFEQDELNNTARWVGVTPLRGRSEPPRHDGVRQHPSSPGLRNNPGLELGLDPAGACAEFRDDAARPTRAGALGGDPRAAFGSCRVLAPSALRPVTAERRA